MPGPDEPAESLTEYRKKELVRLMPFAPPKPVGAAALNGAEVVVVMDDGGAWIGSPGRVDGQDWQWRPLPPVPNSRAASQAT